MNYFMMNYVPVLFPIAPPKSWDMSTYPCLCYYILEKEAPDVKGQYGLWR